MGLFVEPPPLVVGWRLPVQLAGLVAVAVAGKAQTVAYRVVTQRLGRMEQVRALVGVAVAAVAVVVAVVVVVHKEPASAPGRMERLVEPLAASLAEPLAW